MATSRQERMQERMRGAGRHQVEDVSFGFVLPVEEDEQPDIVEEPAPAAAAVVAPPPPPALAPAPARPPPNTSIKRKNLADRGENFAKDAAVTGVLATSAALPPPPPPGAVSSSSLEQQMQRRRTTPQAAVRTVGQQHESSQQKKQRQSSGLRRVSYADEIGGIAEDEEPEQRQQLPRRSPAQQKRASQIPSSPAAVAAASTPGSVVLAEEVGESPVDAPGSGRRRVLPISERSARVVGSSVLLQRMLEDMDETAEHPASSPLERLAATRRSGESLRSSGVSSQQQRSNTRRRSARLSGSSPVGGGRGEDESAVPVSGGDDDDEIEDSVPEVEVVAQEQKQNHEDEEPAEEIDEQEAARRLGRKRPRRSIPTASPDLGSGLMDGMEPEHEEPEPEPIAKRRRTTKKLIPVSPAVQQQPKTKASKPRTKPPAREKPLPKKQTAARKKKSNPTNEDEDAEADGGSVPITVQRFTKDKTAATQHSKDDNAAGNDDDDGILTTSIPYANRAGVNAVDVLSKLCEELIDALVAKLEQRAQTAEDAATKREQRTMASTLEAFQEELRTRLLEHTIALDTLHALRKRVRVAQKEKLSLRDEIMRVRAERDQVALRMDAIRIRHEADSKEALRHISLSSAMHDIDLAVERGQAAPALSAAEQKKADLAGLELLISRVTDQVCPHSDTGGTLKQIRDFNALLERAAGVLEGRNQLR
ncbi:hypothetical protein B0H66DRAFT_526976 [Apodospora peruviana]|uniref:Inner kinetochore subunit AME1 domain-containing protein n=1 Tax=Apodospora peruviana TaxID=516989 RepID=A0AAE0IQN9_9PEZI|nr:hypothetical protein B0H66DRAFT_526976 [Apodospora peruviana]